MRPLLLVCTLAAFVVGAYVLELDAYYSKPENRSVTLVEALFCANDALRKP